MVMWKLFLLQMNYRYLLQILIKIIIIEYSPPAGTNASVEKNINYIKCLINHWKKNHFIVGINYIIILLIRWINYNFKNALICFEVTEF